MEMEHRDVDVVKKLGMILDGVAATEEDDNFLLELFLEEGEEEEESWFRGADDVALSKGVNGASGVVILHIDVDSARA